MGLTKHILLENDGKETLQTILKRVAFKLNDVGMV
jgi:transcription initiation factor IIF auxiliary subunit